MHTHAHSQTYMHTNVCFYLSNVLFVGERVRYQPLIVMITHTRTFKYNYSNSLLPGVPTSESDTLN